MRVHLSCLLLGGLTGLIGASEDEWTPHSSHEGIGDSDWELQLQSKDDGSAIRLIMIHPDRLQTAEDVFDRSKLSECGISNQMPMDQVCPLLNWVCQNSCVSIEDAGQGGTLGVNFNVPQPGDLPSTELPFRLTVEEMPLKQQRTMLFKLKELKAEAANQGPSTPIEDSPISIADSQELPDLRNVVPRTFDLSKVDQRVFDLVKSTQSLIKTNCDNRWHTAGITKPFLSGTHSVKIKVLQSEHNEIMIGVIPVNQFDGESWYHSGKALAYWCNFGRLFPEAMSFGPPSKANDEIEMRVHMDEVDQSQSTFAFFKNGRKMGTNLFRLMSEFIHWDGPLMFAVQLREKNDQVQIVG